MRLDELNFEHCTGTEWAFHPVEPAAGIRVWFDPNSRLYYIRDMRDSSAIWVWPEWHELDPAAAQAVLYHLLGDTDAPG